MTKSTALRMLGQYCECLSGYQLTPVLRDAGGMFDRWPDGGSVRKAMRWLGYMQGVLVATNYFSLEAVKAHSKAGEVSDAKARVYRAAKIPLSSKVSTGTDEE